MGDGYRAIGNRKRRAVGIEGDGPHKVKLRIAGHGLKDLQTDPAGSPVDRYFDVCHVTPQPMPEPVL